MVSFFRDPAGLNEGLTSGGVDQKRGMPQKVSWLHGFRTNDGEPLRGLSWRSGLHGEPLQGAGGIVALWCARREQVLTIPKGEVQRLTLD